MATALKNVKVNNDKEPRVHMFGYGVIALLSLVAYFFSVMCFTRGNVFEGVAIFSATVCVDIFASELVEWEEDMVERISERLKMKRSINIDSMFHAQRICAASHYLSGTFDTLDVYRDGVVLYSSYGLEEIPFRSIDKVSIKNRRVTITLLGLIDQDNPYFIEFSSKIKALGFVSLVKTKINKGTNISWDEIIGV